MLNSDLGAACYNSMTWFILTDINLDKLRCVLSVSVCLSVYVLCCVMCGYISGGHRSASGVFLYHTPSSLVRQAPSQNLKLTVLARLA